MQRKTGNLIAANTGTLLLWALWLSSIYYVALDLRSGVFRTYMEAGFWEAAGAGSGVFVAALLALVLYRRYFTSSVIVDLRRPRARSEEDVMHEIFGLDAEALASAKLSKNLLVNFTGNDLLCEVRETSVATSLTAG